MAYANGDIPTSALVWIQQGHYLTPLAAAAWKRIVAKVEARYGWRPQVTDSYRPLATQVAIFRQRYVAQASGGGYYGDVRWWNGVRYVRRRGYAAAAVPGTSNHGWATAVDVTGLGAFGSTKFNQFAACALEEGYSNAEGRSVNEPWHWTKNSASLVNNPGQGVGTVPSAPGATPIPGIEPEEDMPLTQSDLEAMDRVFDARLRRLFGSEAFGVLLAQAAYETLDRVIASELDGRLRVRDGAKVPAGDAGVLLSQAGKEELDRVVANRMDERFKIIFEKLDSLNPAATGAPVDVKQAVKDALREGTA